MVSCMDNSFARLIEALHDRSMLENSIVVFSTDNGGASNNFQAGAGNNLPLRFVQCNTRGHGGTLVKRSPPTSEIGVRIPARPQVGKMEVACCWLVVYNTKL